MFSSIKWKFIVVYFLLVFIAMVIVGIFIVGNLEKQQIEAVTNAMEQRLETISRTSTAIATDDWIENREEIQNTIVDWNIGSNEALYVIYDEDIPIILASSSKQYESQIGQNALASRLIDAKVVTDAFRGEKAESRVKDPDGNVMNKHLAYPVYSSIGKIKGILYMTSNLDNVYSTVNNSKTIITNATFLALLITIFLGFLISSSITVPIRDVTRKAEEMAKGDFDQFVDVKSDDEIGQLASMFNYLTLKLKDTIKEMDLERSKLDTIFNYMAEGVVAVDTNGYIIHANPIALNILGLEMEDLHNKKTLDLEEINLQHVNYENYNSLEGSTVTAINSEVFKVKYAPFNNEKNKIGGLIVVFQDITQEHKLDNMRKEFVANVSHELKTPITTIKSYTETLMENDIEKELSQKFLSVIDSESDRMARLVRDLLQLSNIDYKKTNWEKSETNIGKVLHEIISKLDLVIKEKEHMVKLEIADNLPNIVIDKDGIEQVILNIISNAIKYTEPGGKIHISALSTHNELVLKIKDNGLGIPIEDQNRIFERFYRVEKGRSRDMGGTGLGLSIAKEIVEAHNGTIELESIPKLGTEITIKLPLV